MVPATMNRSVRLLTVMLALFACHARADVYAYEDDQGVLTVSDRASDPRARVVFREPSATHVDGHAVRRPRASEQLTKLVGEVARQHALDVDLLHAVIAVESGFDPRAVSPRGARGLMQLMPATAQRFGVTDPFDARQNLSGGARYLRTLLDRFAGDVPLALAAYNAGEGAVDRHGGRIPPYLETQRYVPRVLAMRDAGIAGATP